MKARPKAPRRSELNFCTKHRTSPAFKRGQSLVEYALVVPALLLLLAGGADLARAYFVGIEVSNAAREASLYVAGNAPYTNSSGYSAVLPPSGHYTGCPSSGGSEGPAVDAGCSSYSGSPLSCPSNEVSWTFSPASMPTSTSAPGNSFQVTVVAKCQLDLLTPLLPPHVTISSTSTSWVLQD